MRVLDKPKIFAKSVAQCVLSLLTSPEIARLIGEPFFWMMGRRKKILEIDLSQVKRVLVVRLDKVGDVVLTTPLLRELRRNLVDAWITLVVNPQVYNLVELCPYVDEVLTYDWKVDGRCVYLQRHWRALWLAWCCLWRRRFDLAILPRWDVDNYHGTFILYFSGAPWRVGYSENINSQKKRLNSGFDSLLTHPLQDSTIKHDVEHNLDVIRFLGGRVQDDRLELWLGKEDEAFADETLGDHGVKPGDLLIAFCPGAGEPKRRWPVSRYTELGLWLQRKYRACLVIIGGPGEEVLGWELLQELGSSPIINIVGRTTLRQTVAFLKRCSLYIGNDTGPMHMAAAVGVPIVELSCHPVSGAPYSVNSPLRFRPWRDNHIVIQPERPLPPCEDECIADQPHCILSITVEQVKEAVAEQLKSTKE